MNCDPLAQAHLGFFTCAGTNCNPCSVFNLGFFVDEEDTKKVAGRPNGSERYSQSRINKLLEWREDYAETAFFERGRSKVEVERVPVIKVKRLPISMDDSPLYEIEDYVDREIAKELRFKAIQEHAQLVREEIEETRKLDEEILLIIVASEL